jgi:hypothetical protein
VHVSNRNEIALLEKEDSSCFPRSTEPLATLAQAMTCTHGESALYVACFLVLSTVLYENEWFLSRKQPGFSSFARKSLVIAPRAPLLPAFLRILQVFARLTDVLFNSRMRFAFGPLLHW